MSNPAVSPWDTPGITQRLRELHRLKGDAELTMTEIAEQLNREFKTEFTRNSASSAAATGSTWPSGRAVFNVHHAKKRVEKMIPINKRVRVDAPIVPEMPAVEDTSSGITILQLRSTTCRWPLGDLMETRPPYLYCGKPAAIECPYCRTHMERSRGRSIPSIARVA